MTVKQINLTLWMLCAALAVASLTVVIAAARSPLATHDLALSSTSRSHINASAGPATLPSEEEFQTLFARTYRSSLDGSIKTPADVPALSPELASPSQVKLIGTVGTGLAILKGPDGSEALAEIGEDVNGAILIAIRPSEVDLRTASGQTLTLRRAPDEDSPDVQIRDVSPSASR